MKESIKKFNRKFRKENAQGTLNELSIQSALGIAAIS